MLAKLGIGAAALILAGIGVFFFSGLFQKAALSVTSDPANAKVILEGKEVGKTPFYSNQLGSGEKSLSFGNFNQKVALMANALTVVDWVNGPSEIFSAGEVVWFSGAAGTELLAIAKPGGQVFLDGKLLGDSPLSTAVGLGDHTLELKKDGYFSRSIKIAPRSGLRLNVWANLSLNPFPVGDPKALPTPSPSLKLLDLSTSQTLLLTDRATWARAAAFWDPRVSAGGKATYQFFITSEGKLYDPAGSEISFDSLAPSTGVTTVGYLGDSSSSISASATATLNSLSAKLYPMQPQVEILSTPTGFLRVRSGPGVSYSQIGLAYPGDKYNYLGEQNGWFKISFNGQEGWVSGDYAKKL